jgi:membrane-bound lytic murein transglycosylase B
MGLPQFMPSSVNRFAVDLDGDGHIRLQGDNAADVVGSVAHYLAQAGWQRGMPTHFEVAAPVDTAERAALLGPTSAQLHSRADAGTAPCCPTPGVRTKGPLALVELQNGDLAPSFVAGTQNFYVVTRYNWSAYYAMAVIELAQALRQQMPAR